MDTIEKLTELFRQFPGTGPRQAKRFVHFLLTQNEDFLNALTNQIAHLKTGIAQCLRCQRFYPRMGEKTLCNLCSDTSRDLAVLMVVEKDVDCDNVRRTGAYNGYFFILGGTLPILERDPARKVRARELIARIERGIKEGLKEIILALSVNPEGENTAQYVKKTIEPLTQKYNIKLSTLGRGLSTGTELEYADVETFRAAFTHRG